MKSFKSKALKEFNKNCWLRDVPYIKDDGPLGFSVLLNGRKVCWINSRGEKLLYRHLRAKLDKLAAFAAGDYK